MIPVNYNKPLTLEERKQIEKLIKKGLNCREISEKINRSSCGRGSPYL